MHNYANLYKIMHNYAKLCEKCDLNLHQKKKIPSNCPFLVNIFFGCRKSLPSILCINSSDAFLAPRLLELVVGSLGGSCS